MRAVLWAVLATCSSSAYAGTGIDFDAASGQFGTDGPTWVEPSDILTVTIADEDPRRVWNLQVDFQNPVESGKDAVLATLEDIVMATVGGFKGASVEADLQIALAAALQQTETFLQQATATERDLEQLAEIYEVLEQTAETYADTMGLEDLPEAPLDGAKDAMQVWRQIQDTAESARASRTQEFMVKKGFERVVVKACHEQLGYVDSGLSWQGQGCSSSTYILQVSNPGGVLQVMPGWVVPIEDGELGQGRPLIAVGSSITLHARTQTKLGIDLGAAMGSDSLAPNAYTVGPHVSVAGISVGGGLAMVQSTSQDGNGFSPSPYLRIGLSPNFMDGLKGLSSDKGAQNADAAPADEDEDLIGTPTPTAPRGPAQAPTDNGTDAEAPEAGSDEGAETDTVTPPPPGGAGAVPKRVLAPTGL